jgi:hypothetical protein
LGKRGDQEELLQLEPREHDPPTDLGDVILVGPTDAFEQALDTQALDEARDLSRRTVGKPALERIRRRDPASGTLCPIDRTPPSPTRGAEGKGARGAAQSRREHRDRGEDGGEPATLPDASTLARSPARWASATSPNLRGSSPPATGERFAERRQGAYLGQI